MLTFQIEQFGGLNVNDPAEKLLRRSHRFAENFGWQQIAPVECIQCRNMDWTKDGIKKRAGSTLFSSFSSLLSSGEVFVNSIFYTAAIGAKIIVVVTSNSIYTNESGSFAQINDSSSSPYTHNETVSKSTLAVSDGHLFIGLDGNNKIQVYRNGANLDEELESGNTYIDSFGSGTHSIDGAWGTSYYLVKSFQGRLIYSDGNTVVNYSTIPIATDGIWKRSTHGFYQASGRIIAIKTYTPDYQDSIQETLYIYTDQGPQITNDLETQIQTIEGGPVPLNYKSITPTKSWLMMLTEDRRIVAMNRNITIDIGRRFNKYDGTSEIENFNIAGAENKAFSYYNPVREQIYFFVPTDSEGENKEAFTIDMVLGEPQIGEAQESYEQRLRLSLWTVNASATNDFYAGMIKNQNDVLGITPDGNVYAFLVGRNDFNSLPIAAYYEMLEFRAGLPATRKLFKILKLRGKFISNYSVDVTYNFDNAVTGEIFTRYGEDKYGEFKYGKVSTVAYSSPEVSAQYGTFLYGSQSYTKDFIAKGKDKIDLKGETFTLRLENSRLNETFSFRSINIEYKVLNSDI